MASLDATTKITGITAPESLKQPALSDTRWLAKISKEFKKRIADGFHHPLYKEKDVTLGAGLPNPSTYSVVKNIVKGVQLLAHKVLPIPRSIKQFREAITKPREFIQKCKNPLQKLSNMFNYGSTQGPDFVLKAFCDRMRVNYGLNFEPKNITAVSGGTTSLIDNVVRSFEDLDGQFAVFVSKPAYTGTIARLAKAKNIKVFTVECDEQGMKPESLREQKEKARAMGLYLAFSIDVTHGHNPGGYSSTPERIQANYDVISTDTAGRLDTMFHIEDDPYSDFNYTSKDLTSYAAIDKHNRVVTFKTESKTGIPGLRSAFAHSKVVYVLPGKDGKIHEMPLTEMLANHETEATEAPLANMLLAAGAAATAPAEKNEDEDREVTLTDMLLAAGGMAYLIPNTLSLIFTVASWFAWDMETVVSQKEEMRKRTAIYKANRDALLDSLSTHFGGLKGNLVDWNEPKSGIFTTLKLKKRPINQRTGQPMTSREIVEWLMENEFLITTPMTGFYTAEDRAENPDLGEDELRLSFSYGNPADMTEGARRLAEGIKILLGEMDPPDWMRLAG